MKRMMICFALAAAVSSSLVGAPTVEERLAALRQDEMLLEYLGKDGIEEQIGYLNQCHGLDKWGDLRWEEWRFSRMVHSLKSEDPVKKTIIDIFWSPLHEYNASIAADIEEGSKFFIGKDGGFPFEESIDPRLVPLVDEGASEESVALGEPVLIFYLWLEATSKKDFFQMNVPKFFLAECLKKKASSLFPELVRILREALVPWMQKVAQVLKEREKLRKFKLKHPTYFS